MAELKTTTELLREAANAKLRDIEQFKERYLEAWIAETGLHPSECELIHQEGFQDKDTWGTRIFVRRREGDNLIEKSQHRIIKALEAENQKMREALSFYADASYERTLDDDLGYKYNPEEWLWNEPEILEDGGQRAREALKTVNAERTDSDAQT